MPNISSLVSSADVQFILEDQHGQIDTLCAQLARQVQRTMRPLGFSNNQTEWHGDVPRILKRINIEYRHDAKVDIIEGARKIRRMKVDWSEFLDRFTACTELGDTLNDLNGILRGLFNDRQPQLTPALKRQYNDVLLTADASVKVFHFHLESAQKRFTTHQAALEVMCMGAAEVRVFAMRLDNPASRSQNIKGVRPLLADLLAQYDLRVALEGQAAGLYNELTDISASHTSIQRRFFNEKMSEYDTILSSLQQQQETQAETLKKAMVFFDRAASTPTSLMGLWPGTTVDVASLRSAPSEFREILETIEIMEDLSTPLHRMLTGVTSTLRRGVPFNVNRDLMDAASFISALGAGFGL